MMITPTPVEAVDTMRMTTASIAAIEGGDLKELVHAISVHEPDDDSYGVEADHTRVAEALPCARVRLHQPMVSGVDVLWSSSNSNGDGNGDGNGGGGGENGVEGAHIRLPPF